MQFLITPGAHVLLSQSASSIDALTSRHILGCTSAYDDEWALLPAQGNAQARAKVGALYAHGQVVVQPFYVSALPVNTSDDIDMPRVQDTLDAILIAAMHKTVYLHDPDHERSVPKGCTVPLWTTCLGNPRPSGDGNIDTFFTTNPK